MKTVDEHLEKELQKRRKANAFRKLPSGLHGVDFCSNDYLGLARESLALKDGKSYGATGSRLISGNHEAYLALENFLSTFHHAETALVFTSGYTANLGLIASIAGRHDTILYDQLVHASIRDALQLANCRTLSFRHNDVAHLQEKLHKASGNKWVIVESVYSMDGDETPLEQILSCCEAAQAALIVDEAHAIGVLGPGGRGAVVEQGLETRVWARVITFGKALGSHGAAVLGNAVLRDYLINFARPFIYTTGLPPDTLNRVRAAYQFLEGSDRIKDLHKLIGNFQAYLGDQVKRQLIPSRSAIQSILVPGNNEVKILANRLRESGLDVLPILHPTVPKGKERLRICLHSFNTIKELGLLTQQLNKII